MTDHAGAISWIARIRARLRALATRGAGELPEDSLLSFAPEGARLPPHPATRAPAVAPTLAVVLVAFSSGVVVALWLEWQPQAASDGGGMMAITSEPPGFTVYVDGARAGVTPAKLMLKPGDYLIAVGDGDERRSRTITMRSGDGFVHFEGTRAPAERLGELRIETEPAGLQVRLDGQARGTAPLVIQVPAGSHFVTVSAPGTAVNREVVVKAGARTSVLIAAGTGFTPR